MLVTIMYRNSFTGGDGWRYWPITREISDKCPVCGGPRGKPEPNSYCEDGEWHILDNWTNVCGHLDKYQDVYLNEILPNEK